MTVTRFKGRRGTAAQAASANEVLAAGEYGFETDTGVLKIGDGTTAWNDLSPHVPPALLAALGMSASVVDTAPRLTVSNSQTTNVDGTLYLTYFTPLVNLTVSQISMQSGATSLSSGLTLARMALYTAVANGDATLVARTASDTTLFDTTNEVETRAFATAGGYPATYDLVAGTRYAVGVLQVGTTPGRIAASLMPIGAAVIAPIVAAIKTGQSDIAGNVTSVATPIVQATPWARLS